VAETRGTCDSCGRTDEDLAEVHRAYLTPETWDTPGRVDIVPDLERWCLVCRAHYPHEPVED
jgi:hypothetical protein